MSETARDTPDEAEAGAAIEAQAGGTCEKPVSRNCEGTALYTVILNLPDSAITVPCCEPCRDEHVKRAKAEGVPVTVRTGTRTEAVSMSPQWKQRVRHRITSWSGRLWLALVIIVLLLLISVAAVLLW